MTVDLKELESRRDELIVVLESVHRAIVKEKIRLSTIQRGRARGIVPQMQKLDVDRRARFSRVLLLRERDNLEFHRIGAVLGIGKNGANSLYRQAKAQRFFERNGQLKASGRTVNCLINMGIKTLEELRAAADKDAAGFIEKVIRFPNAGRVVAAEVLFLIQSGETIPDL